MQLHFGSINNSCDNVIDVFGRKGIKFDVCDLKEPSKFTSTVASSVRKSISKSATASKSKSKTGGDVALLDNEEIATKKCAICTAKPATEE